MKMYGVNKSGGSSSAPRQLTAAEQEAARLRELQGGASSQNPGLQEGIRNREGGTAQEEFDQFATSRPQITDATRMSMAPRAGFSPPAPTQSQQQQTALARLQNLLGHFATQAPQLPAVTQYTEQQLSDIVGNRRYTNRQRGEASAELAQRMLQISPNLSDLSREQLEALRGHVHSMWASMYHGTAGYDQARVWQDEIWAEITRRGNQ